MSDISYSQIKHNFSSMVAGVISLNIDGHIVLCLILWSVSGYIEGHSVLEMSLLDSPQLLLQDIWSAYKLGTKGNHPYSTTFNIATAIYSAQSKSYLFQHIVSTVSI